MAYRMGQSAMILSGSRALGSAAQAPFTIYVSAVAPEKYLTDEMGRLGQTNVFHMPGLSYLRWPGIDSYGVYAPGWEYVAALGEFMRMGCAPSRFQSGWSIAPMAPTAARFFGFDGSKAAGSQFPTSQAERGLKAFYDWSCQGLLTPRTGMPLSAQNLLGAIQEYQMSVLGLKTILDRPVDSALWESMQGVDQRMQQQTKEIVDNALDWSKQRQEELKPFNPMNYVPGTGPFCETFPAICEFAEKFKTALIIGGGVVGAAIMWKVYRAFR